MANNLPLKLATIALFLAVEVVLMGGFTRITDSGLGCPDWPGCFGKMAMTTDTETIAHLQERYPEIHVAVHKGWIEMIHRYIAGGLGLLIMGIAYLGYREKDKTPNYPYLVSLALLGLVIIQGAFGAFTVTLKLLPNIVTLHLMGGLIIVSTLMYLRNRLKRLANGDTQAISMRIPVLVGIGLLFAQIILEVGYRLTMPVGHAQGCSVAQAAARFNTIFGVDSICSQRWGQIMKADSLSTVRELPYRWCTGPVPFVVLAYWLVLLAVYLKRGVLTSRKASHFIGLTLVQILFGYANVIYAVPDSLAFIHHALGVLLLFAAWSIAYETATEQEDAVYGNLRHA